MLLDTDQYIDFKYKRSINFGSKINIKKLTLKYWWVAVIYNVQIVSEVAAFIILNFWILLLCKKSGCLINDSTVHQECHIVLPFQNTIEAFHWCTIN